MARQSIPSCHLQDLGFYTLVLAPVICMEQSANIPGNLKLWSKNTHTGQIYPGLRHTIKIFLATVTVATLILACFIYRSHIRIRVPLHIMPAFSTVEIIQLTGRPPYKYPIQTQRCLSPNRPLPLQIPHPYPALCLQTAQHDMPSTPPATCACTGPLGYKPAGRTGQRVTLCPSSLQREQHCTRSGIFSSALL